MTPIPPCVEPPPGLVSWWRAEADATDWEGANDGSLNPGTGYAPGKVGQAFSIQAAGGGVDLGMPPNLQLQDFSIEAWVRRGSAAKAGWDIYNHALIVSWAWGGFGLGLYDSGQLFLSKIGYSAISPTLSITDTDTFHHVAVTKSGTNVVFYLDGIAEQVGSYDPGFVFAGSMAIGTRGGDHVVSFDGLVDEASIYNRALSSVEVEAIYNADASGKCLLPIPPTIAVQPADQSITIGENATFNVAAGGTKPLSYQWIYKGSAIPGATNSILVLTNVQGNQAGIYDVQITNTVGSVVSSNATLTVNFAPASVQMASTTITPDGSVILPILLLANGNENALGFSLNFPPSLLSYINISLGNGAPGAALFANTNQIANGQLGVLLSLPTDATFPAGTRQSPKSPSWLLC